MSKVPQYTKDAINRYNAKFDRVSINLPKGTKERIKERTDKSYNEYIKTLVSANLNEKQPMQNMEIKNKPYEGGERVQVQMTAKLRDEILQFTDDISKYIKDAVYDRLNRDRRNAPTKTELLPDELPFD